MSEVTDLVMPILRQLQADMGDVKEDLHNIKVRTMSVEAGFAALNGRMDSFDFRMERIERRLNLIEV
ncbi:MAG: hypothetical protein ACOY4K_15275 [Pseudomonadota bacterium]